MNAQRLCIKQEIEVNIDHRLLVLPTPRLPENYDIKSEHPRQQSWWKKNLPNVLEATL